MKRFFLSAFTFFCFVAAIAQEKSIEIKINGEAADGTGMVKTILLVIFTIIILIFVFRTFRGKAEV